MKKDRLRNIRQGWLPKDSYNSLVSTMVKTFLLYQGYTVRTILSTIAQQKWKVYQLDVKSASLNGIL